MQRMSKSVMLVWLVVFCLIVLAACGQPSEPESTEETNSEQGTEDPQADAEKGENVTQSPDAVESADGPVLQTVNIYHWGSRRRFHRKMRRPPALPKLWKSFASRQKHKKML